MKDLPPLTFGDLLALGQRVRIPRPTGSTPPTCGQVWRASWDGVASLIVVLSTDDDLLLVAPVFMDFDIDTFGDDEITDLAGHDVLVLRRHARKIAPLTLDTVFGDMHMQHDKKTHTVIDSEIEDEMTEPLNKLATWTTHGEGNSTIREHLRALGVTAKRLATDLGEPLTVAAQILRNIRPLTPEQAEVLGGTLSLTADELLKMNPTLPPQWLQELQKSSYRAPIQALARQHDKTDSDTWRSIAYGAYALAARQSNDQEPASIRARISTYLQSEMSQDG